MKTTLFYRFMCWYDASWRRRHGVERFDELLSFSFETFSGERRIMNDGTWIEPGDYLAILHFNRECFSSSSSDPRQYARNALRFRRLILASFKSLAQAIHQNEKFTRVKAFHGVSWLPPHGEKLGFLIERMPNSAINTVRKLYFTLLLRVFFPHLAAQENNRIQPHAYWLTRDNLLKNFSVESAANEFRTNQ